jgi:hypothetical protein
VPHKGVAHNATGASSAEREDLFSAVNGRDHAGLGPAVGVPEADRSSTHWATGAVPRMPFAADAWTAAQPPSYRPGQKGTFLLCSIRGHFYFALTWANHFFPVRNRSIRSSSLIPVRNSSIALCESGLQTNRKCPPVSSTAWHRLAGEQIVTEIDRIEPGIPRALRRQPAPGGPAFAILLIVPILRDDELRLQRHDPIMPRRHDGGGEQGMEILGLVLAALAMGTVGAMNLNPAVGRLPVRAESADQ